MTDYRATIQATPELAYWLADRITPTNRPSDGIRPRGHRADAANDTALDDLTTLAIELTESVRFWQAAFEDLDRAPVVPIPVCSDQPAVAVAVVAPLSRWLLTNWDEACGHPFHDWWCESLDEWLVPLVKRMQRDPKRQHPRRCELCGTLSVWADLEHATGLCAQCGHIHRAEIWKPIQEAAAIIDRHPKNIRQWIRDGDLDAIKRGRTQYVELTQARTCRDLKDARKKLGKAS